MYKRQPYLLALLGGISDTLSLAGYSLLLTTMLGKDTPVFQTAEGIILLGQGAHDEAVKALDHLSIPLVVWGAPVSYTHLDVYKRQVSAIGDRFNDNPNTVTLKGYTKIDAGLNFDLGKVIVTISGDNLTNEHALTEGDPRIVTAANGRPIFGRSFKLSLGYKF